MQEVFSDIYASRRWGAGESFDSGWGSRGDAAAGYVRYVRELIGQCGGRSVVDIGCGDFRVAAQFVDLLDHYEGIDVVQDLIDHNRSRHGGERIRFSVRDAASDPLPDADVCLIRQVLQHLSNAQVAAILEQCRRYPLVVVTEHWPAPDAIRTPNLDKPHGPDTRLDRGSWVDITQAPFHCGPSEEVLRIPVAQPLYRPGETIRTQLWRPRP
ncbi:class I SAM-dependent methyltransferase [Plantactinospora sonchi]|uniref:Class I SAM-dependent methyltransferase n=1 Tax=Plantactinospora sonchi TaxID=1544735 RepID=A0ABU7RRC2_9ACTN